MTAPAMAAARRFPARRIARIALLLFAFLLGIHALGEGFALLGGGLLESFFRATENPFTALLVGIVATSLVQSSSVTTSLIVGLVAAPEDPLPLANAVPMVMGANFGTTVTNTIVALGHLGHRAEFRRAFAVSTCDDFFNFFAVAILLPAEIAWGPIRRTAEALADGVAALGGAQYESPLKRLLEVAYAPIEAFAAWAVDSEPLRGALLAALACALVFASLVALVKTMRKSLESNVEAMIEQAFERPAVVAMMLGLGATLMVQSSSIVTSLLVPLAGAGLLTLERAYPVVLGSNVGTTVTALLAAAAATGPNAKAGVAIALAHLLFNSAGVALLYPLRAVRDIPLNCSRKLADIGARSAPLAIAYVVGLFYGVPLLLALLNGAGE